MVSQPGIQPGERPRGDLGERLTVLHNGEIMIRLDIEYAQLYEKFSEAEPPDKG